MARKRRTWPLRERHYEITRQIRWLPMIEASDDPEVVRARLWWCANINGVEIHDRPGLTPHGRRWSWTVGRRIGLVDGFHSLPLWNQCSILGHELGHSLCVKGMGFGMFYASWAASRRFRLALESLCYRWNVRMRVWRGDSESKLVDYIDWRADKIFDGYKLKRVRNARVEIQRVLRQELR